MKTMQAHMEALRSQREQDEMNRDAQRLFALRAEACPAWAARAPTHEDLLAESFCSPAADIPASAHPEVWNHARSIKCEVGK